MKRLLCVVLCAVALPVALGEASVSAAPAAPTYNAVLTEPTTCEFTVDATWGKTAKVDQVFGIWSLDGVAFENHLFTTVAPGTGPNAGTFKGRTATFHVGPLATASETHTVYARIQFYYRGAHQSETLLNLPALCTRN